MREGLCSVVCIPCSHCRLAPLPRPKVQIVLKNVAEAKDFLAKGI